MQMREFVLSRNDFRRVRAMIHARAGIALSDAKKDMVFSRLVRRLRALQLDSFNDYLDQLEQHPAWEEWQEFTNALTTNLTSFFREAHHFEMLRQQFLASKSRPFRVWCAASSTGEEPYSLAITLAEAAHSLAPPVQIIASDIDTRVLETARAGVYPLERLEKLSRERIKRYFQRGTGRNEGYCRVVEPLRKLIDFREINLLDGRWDFDAPFDAIFCRNVMIYFDKPTQRRVLEKFLPLLRPDGRLYAGHSESFLHSSHLFHSCGRTVYAPVTAQAPARAAAHAAVRVKEPA
ncbi:MAG TPA: CheR family methyltransferase [Nevskiaceae bacterium]|nr:CheR family methyltransferase [Nevskiaceae bacterium]